jgi:hypothetical protein
VRLADQALRARSALTRATEASSAFSVARGERATADPRGEDLPALTAANEERRCGNIASPERRTREASPSYS